MDPFAVQQDYKLDGHDLNKIRAIVQMLSRPRFALAGTVCESLAETLELVLAQAVQVNQQVRTVSGERRF